MHYIHIDMLIMSVLNTEIRLKKDISKQPIIITIVMMYICLALTTAMSARNLQRLEDAVKRAEAAGLEKKLGLQLGMAQRVLEQLKRIEKLKHEIMQLNQKTIAEIKSYSHPPEGVHQVMMASFVLLGDDPAKLKVSIGLNKLKDNIVQLHKLQIVLVSFPLVV